MPTHELRRFGFGPTFRPLAPRADPMSHVLVRDMSNSLTRISTLFGMVPLRLTAFALLPLALAVALAGFVSLQALEELFERHHQGEIEMVGRALRIPVSDALDDGRFTRLERSLKSAGDIGRVYGVAVYDRRGELVAELGRHASPDAHELARLIDEGERTGEYTNASGRRVYSYFVPLSGPGQSVTGLLQVTRRKRDIEEFVGELRRRAGLLIGVVLLLLTVSMIGGHYVAVGRSLQELRRSIGRIESGDRRHRPRLRGPREVAGVASSLNSMLDSIDEAERRISRERESRARLEERLRRSEQLAAIGRLAGGLAHELGSPLTLVDGHAQRALRHPELPRTARSEIESVRREAKRMTRLVRQLLDYGRPERHSGVSMEARRLVTICLSSLGALRENEVRMETSGEVGDVKIFGEESKLETALINILRNAVEAARSRVELRWTSTGESVVFAVDDDGPGVHESIRDTLFEPFVTTKRAQGGTGLGLAIAHAAAVESGGQLECSGSSLGGARFELILPRDRSDAVGPTGVSDREGRIHG